MAITKLSIVPINTYSVFLVSPSLNLKIDFAAIKKPTASNSPRITKVRVSILSKEPINRPAFSKSASV